MVGPLNRCRVKNVPPCRRLTAGLSAFVLVCVHVGSEIGRFMFALMSLDKGLDAQLRRVRQNRTVLSQRVDAIQILPWVTLLLSCLIEKPPSDIK